MKHFSFWLFGAIMWIAYLAFIAGMAYFVTPWALLMPMIFVPKMSTKD